MTQAPTPQTPTTDTATDLRLRRFREYVTGIIALIVIIGTTALIVLAAVETNATSADQFSRVKDLLLFVNPLLGVVIGYYFTKTSTEARAESAEVTANTATANAQQAFQERSEALTQANEARAKEQQTKSGLDHLTLAAENYLSLAPSGTPGVLGSPNPAFDDVHA